jgi:hypothetical protein
MIRISVTELDSYLYWRDTEEADLGELLTRLRGEQEQTQQMITGKAFHKLFEDSQEGELMSPVIDGIQFVFAIEEELAIPAVRELKAEHVFQTRLGPITLVGKVDSLEGLVIHDYKLTEKFDIERYTDSYQWRSYLTMFNAYTFVYDVFVGRYDTQRDGSERVYIHDYHRLPIYAYPDMRTDVERVVTELADLIVKYVPEKIAA